MATPDGTSPSARDKRMGLTGPPRVARGGVPTAGLVSVTGPAGGYSGLAAFRQLLTQTGVTDPAS